MTGGWAATNTLRRALTSDGAHSRYFHGRSRWDQFSEEVDQERAALALVEAALDAAERVNVLLNTGLDRDDGWEDPDTGEWVSRPTKAYRMMSRNADEAVDLAAALRAVREGA